MKNHLNNFYHYFLSWLGNLIYRSPSREIFVLGVTGTKGKSTTLELINAILEAAGKKTAIVSSLRFKIGEETVKNTTGMTMPGRFFIQKKMREAVNAGCQYFLIEVTSQGIVQHRHRFIDFDAALYLNVQPEHVEAHGSFEKYREAKVGFFQYVAKKSHKFTKLFFINDGDPSKTYFMAATEEIGQIIYFSRGEFIEKELNNGKVSIGDWLANNFNLENAAAANAFAKSQRIDWDVIRQTLERFSGIPGRLEYIQHEPFAVVIDYAHTPDSLIKIYQALDVGSDKLEVDKDKRTSRIPRPTSHVSRLICVLGAAGGGRDKWKRPEMGKIAAQYCRDIILTNEDPYDEDLAQIVNEIKSGILQTQFPIARIKEIIDRHKAIKQAISLAKKGDVVIITGKGSEDWIHGAKGRRWPWSERKAVEEAINTGN